MQPPLIFVTVQPIHALALELLPLKGKKILLTPLSPPWDFPTLEVVPAGGHITNTLDLLLSPSSRKLFQRFPSSYVLFFKNSHQLEQIVHSLGGKVLASSPSVARKLENKLFFPTLLEKLGIPHPPHEILSLGESLPSFSPPYLVQFSKGFGGKGTFLVRNSSEWQLLTQKGRKKQVKVTPYLEDSHTISLNGCVLSHSVRIGTPYRQITGIPFLTPFPFASCGCDFDTTPIPKEVLRTIQKESQKIGHYLRETFQFRGFFGLDWLWNPTHGLFCLEINPRLTNTLFIHTALEKMEGRRPLLQDHLELWLSSPKEEDSLAPCRSSFPLSQLIVQSFSEGFLSPLSPCFLPPLKEVRKTSPFVLPFPLKSWLFLPQASGLYLKKGKEIARLIGRANAVNSKGEIHPVLKQLLTSLLPLPYRLRA